MKGPRSRNHYVEDLIYLSERVRVKSSKGRRCQRSENGTDSVRSFPTCANSVLKSRRYMSNSFCEHNSVLTASLSRSDIYDVLASVNVRTGSVHVTNSVVALKGPEQIIVKSA